jgi:hypothetical protein
VADASGRRPTPPPQYTLEEWGDLADALRFLGARLGEFDVDDATAEMLGARLRTRRERTTQQDLYAVLADFQELGYIEPSGRRGESGPLLWRWAGAPETAATV